MVDEKSRSWILGWKKLGFHNIHYLGRILFRFILSVVGNIGSRRLNYLNDNVVSAVTVTKVQLATLQCVNEIKRNT